MHRAKLHLQKISQIEAGTMHEVYVALVPVDVLLDLLFLKIDRKYAPVTLALPAAAHDGCRDELW